MRFLRLVLNALALQSFSVSGAAVERAELETRNNVDICKAALIALKASAFCSSFVPITDVTVTPTATTVTAACTSAVEKIRRHHKVRLPPQLHHKSDGR